MTSGFNTVLKNSSSPPIDYPILSCQIKSHKYKYISFACFCFALPLVSLFSFHSVRLVLRTVLTFYYCNNYISSCQCQRFSVSFITWLSRLIITVRNFIILLLFLLLPRCKVFKMFRVTDCSSASSFIQVNFTVWKSACSDLISHITIMWYCTVLKTILQIISIDKNLPANYCMLW